jgi:hypothetical protein
VRTPHVKDWNSAYATLPGNYTLLDPALGERQLPPDVDFDLVLSQNKFGQFQLLAPIAAALHLPLLTVEHTLPHPSWSPSRLAHLKGMRGHRNVFISEFSRLAWGWPEDSALVVRHGVDTDVFSPGLGSKSVGVLSVVNDFATPERLWCCGFDFWREAVQGLPWTHLGSDPNGWSRPAASVADLVDHYRSCEVFVDTASASPIPTVVLEAMACGAVVVSRGNAMVPDVITHGVDGFICDTPAKMRKQLKEILADPGVYREVGARARQTIVSRFSLERFVSDWDGVLRGVAQINYEGPAW